MSPSSGGTSVSVWAPEGGIGSVLAWFEPGLPSLETRSPMVTGPVPLSSSGVLAEGVVMGRSLPLERLPTPGHLEVRLLELLDVDVLEGQHPHRLHEARRAVHVPDPGVGQRQLEPHLAVEIGRA